MDRITPYHSFTGKQAGIYSQKDISLFIARISTGQRADGILRQLIQKVSLQTFNTNTRRGRGIYWTEQMTNTVYLDSLISPEYWIKKFKGTFGEINYYIQMIGSYFAFIAFCGLIIKIFQIVCRVVEINKLSDNSMNCGRVVCSSIFNVFIISGITNFIKKEFDRSRDMMLGEEATAPIYQFPNPRFNSENHRFNSENHM